MSVDIIFPELFSSKADSRRYLEKFWYILSLLRYFRVRRTRIGIPKNFFLQYVFHCL